MSFDGYMQNDTYSNIEDELPQEQKISQETPEQLPKVEKQQENPPLQTFDLSDVQQTKVNIPKLKVCNQIDKEMIALIVILIAIIYFMMG